jgi:hypothetical protein
MFFVTCDPSFWSLALDLYPYGYDLTAGIPDAPCEICHYRMTGETIPRVETRWSEIFSELESFGLSDSTLRKISSKFNFKSPRKSGTIALAGTISVAETISIIEATRRAESISRTDFLVLAGVIRRQLGLAENFPVLPCSRVGSMRIRKFGKTVLPLTMHDFAHGTMTVAPEIAERIVDAGVTGVIPYKCRMNTRSEERYELVTEKVGSVLATDLQLAEYNRNWTPNLRPPSLMSDGTPFFTIVPEVFKADDPEHPRCRLCGFLPYRKYLRNSGLQVVSEYDFFRLKDFSGLYVSARGKDLLSDISKELIFKPV